MIRLTDILCEDCWDGYKQVGMKEKNGKMVPNCVPIEELYHRPESDVTSDSDFKPDQDNKRDQFGSESVNELTEGEFCKACLAEYIKENHNILTEAEYQGRKVKLGKPFRTPGGPKKFSVYVKNKKGNAVKVNFGDPNMKIKKSIPGRRKSFRARHKCHTAKDRTSARYWSCKSW